MVLPNFNRHLTSQVTSPANFISQLNLFTNTFPLSEFHKKARLSVTNTKWMLEGQTDDMKIEIFLMFIDDTLSFPRDLRNFGLPKHFQIQLPCRMELWNYWLTLKKIILLPKSTNS